MPRKYSEVGIPSRNMFLGIPIQLTTKKYCPVQTFWKFWTNSWNEDSFPLLLSSFLHVLLSQKGKWEIISCKVNLLAHEIYEIYEIRLKEFLLGIPRIPHWEFVMSMVMTFHLWIVLLSLTIGSWGRSWRQMMEHKCMHKWRILINNVNNT